MALFFITLRDAPLSTNNFVGPLVPRNCPRIEYNLPEMTEILWSVFPGHKFPGPFGPFLDTRCPSLSFLPARNLCDQKVGLLNSHFENFLSLKSIVCPSDQVFYKSCRTIAVSAVEALSRSAAYLEMDILRGLQGQSSRG